METNYQAILDLQDEYHRAIMLPKVQERWQTISDKLDVLKKELNANKNQPQHNLNPQ